MFKCCQYMSQLQIRPQTLLIQTKVRSDTFLSWWIYRKELLAKFKKNIKNMSLDLKQHTDLGSNSFLSMFSFPVQKFKSYTYLCTEYLTHECIFSGWGVESKVVNERSSQKFLFSIKHYTRIHFTIDISFLEASSVVPAWCLWFVHF